jgi:dipeptidyl aminopeptidase/acylaminoacyl peptidase
MLSAAGGEIMKSMSTQVVAAAIMVVFALVPAAGASEKVERGNLVIDGIPEIPERVSQRLNQYQNTRSAGIAGWLPDGSGIIIATRFGDTAQLHLVSEPGGARRQLTFFEEPVSGATVNPKTNTLLFGRDVGGSEFYQIFSFDLADGNYRMLTDGKSRNMGPNWSHKGDRFTYTTTVRNGRDMDIHMMSMAEPDVSTPILEKGGAWMAADWSPDDTRVLVMNYISANEMYPYVLELENGELTPLHSPDKRVAYGGAAWSGDGSGIYYSSDEEGEFQSLKFHDFRTGEVTHLRDEIEWDVESLLMSPDGTMLAFIVNADAIDQLHVMDLATNEDLDLPPIPKGVVGGLEFSPDGSKLGLVINTPTGPGDVYSIDLTSGELERWTYSEIGGLNPDSFVDAELIRYPTFDEVDGKSRTIPAFYYRPTGDGPFPVVIDIHGGPEGQERPTFSSTVQYIASELGIAVLAPNVRGSQGYGKSYLQLDNGFKREDSVKDIGSLLDWIETRSELDSNRVVVMGGSYGGYMVLASMVHYNDRLRAGIDYVGISSFVTFLENTQEYRRDLRRVEYGDERDPEMRKHLEAISPLNSVSKISKPLLVIQGLNDPRVPAGESEQIVEAVRQNGGTVWYLLAKDEGHGFRKKPNRDYLADVRAFFLETFLLEK